MRNLKVLGLALVAMFAMSAVAASAASADDLTAEKYPTQLTGANISETGDKFLTTTGTVTCKKATYAASVSGPTTSVSALPSYSSCTAFGFPATIDVNGCEYVFNIGAATTGDADLKCPAGKTVTVTAISAGTLKCTVHVAPQTDIAGTVTYSNTGAGATREVDLKAALSGIDYSHTQGTGLGACPAGSATNGTLEAEGKVTGEVPGTNTHTGIFLS